MELNEGVVVEFRTYWTYKEEGEYVDAFGKVAVKWEDIQRIDNYSPKHWKGHRTNFKGAVIKFYGSEELLVVIDLSFRELVDTWSYKVQIGS